MKKIGMIVLIGVAALSLGYFAFRAIPVAAEETTVQTTAQNPFYGPRMGYGMMGRTGNVSCPVLGADEVSYERLYLHLNEEDRALVDAKQAQLLAGIDLSSMTETEQIAAIAGVKTQLVTFIEENEFVFIQVRP